MNFEPCCVSFAHLSHLLFLPAGQHHGETQVFTLVTLTLGFWTLSSAVLRLQ